MQVAIYLDFAWFEKKIQYISIILCKNHNGTNGKMVKSLKKSILTVLRKQLKIQSY
jgi:septum formation topological specificity factor MinE